MKLSRTAVAGTILLVGVTMTLSTGAFGATPNSSRHHHPTTTTTSTTTAPPGSGSLQIDLSGPRPVLSNGTNNTAVPISATTDNFSPPAHALLIAGAAINNYAYDYDTSLQSVTNSGTPLTWTRRIVCNLVHSCDNGGAEVWMATTGAAPGMIAVTALDNVSQSSSADWLRLDVQVVTDSDGTTPLVGTADLGFGAGSAPKVSATLSPGSLGFAVVSDWSANAGTPAYGPGLTQTDTGLSPPENGNSPDYAWHYFRTAAASLLGGSTVFNMTLPMSQAWDEVVVEAKPG